MSSGLIHNRGLLPLDGVLVLVRMFCNSRQCRGALPICLLMLMQSGVEPPDSLPNADFATAAWDLVHNVGLFALRQHILHPSKDGAECTARSEHHSQVEPTVDLSNLLTYAGHVGDAHHGWGVALFTNARITRGGWGVATKPY